MDDVSAQERQRIPADKGENSSSSDDEEDEASKQLWAKVECVLEEYHLSRFALAAAKRWVRLMGGAYDIASPWVIGTSSTVPVFPLRLAVFAESQVAP